MANNIVRFVESAGISAVNVWASWAFAASGSAWQFMYLGGLVVTSAITAGYAVRIYRGIGAHA